MHRAGALFAVEIREREALDVPVEYQPHQFAVAVYRRTGSRAGDVAGADKIVSRQQVDPRLAFYPPGRQSKRLLLSRQVIQPSECGRVQHRSLGAVPISLRDSEQNPRRPGPVRVLLGAEKPVTILRDPLRTGDFQRPDRFVVFP